jgi:hypothetical protein
VLSQLCSSTCFISPYERKRPTVSRLTRSPLTPAVPVLIIGLQDADKIGHAGSITVFGDNRNQSIGRGLTPLPNPREEIGDVFHCALSAANCKQWTLITGAATRRSIKRKAGGRYAADLVLQLPARGAGSVALHAALTGSTEHLVDAIARGYEVTVLR